MMSLEIYSKKTFYRVLFLLTAAILAISCDHKIQTTRKKADFLPNHASIIIECHNLEKAKANFKNIALIQNNSDNPNIEFFTKNPIIKSFKALNKSFTICFSPTTKGTYETTYLTKDSIFKKFQKDIPLEKFKGVSIHEFEIENTPFWVSTLGNSTTISSNKSFLKSSIEQYTKDVDFSKRPLLKSWNQNAIASFYIDLEKTPTPISFLDGFNKKFNATGQVAGDVMINNQDIVTNAVYDFGKNITNTPFKIQRRQQLLDLFPAATSIINLQVNNTKKEITEQDNTLVDQIQSYGILEDQNKKIIALKLLKTFDAKTLFESLENSDSLTIKQLNTPVTYTDLRLPFEGKIDTLDFGVSIKDYVLLGDKNSLSHFLNKKVSAERILTFKQLIKNINQKSSYQNFKNSNVFFKNIGLADLLKNDQYPLAGISVNENRNYAYLQVSIPKEITQPKVIKKVTTVFEKPIFEPITNGPFFFKNHLTQDNDIVLQTESYKLQLYSSSGKLLWSKALNEPIVGKIQEIDILNNGRLQLTFTTPSKWYVIDRNGKDVGKFPKNFKSEVTQPLAVFDYDKNKKYRFGITQGQQFHIYNTKGKKVGFTFKNNSQGEITTAPKHIRIGSKDYILVNEDKGGIHFLSRTGKERIKLNKSIFSSNEWFLYKNTFSTLSSDHLLTQVNTSGKIGKLKKHPSDKFTKIDATAKTWVSLTGNKLFIKNKKASLEFGSYTSPKVFYLKDKIYVSITNQESDKTYLFDSNAKPIKDFPIRGNQLIDMRLDKFKKNLDIVTIDQNNSLLLYKLRIR